MNLHLPHIYRITGTPLCSDYDNLDSPLNVLLYYKCYINNNPIIEISTLIIRIVELAKS